ncbi:hypothetical protein BDA96_04G267400 [Sorghum bicolor]|uniref:Uncharacterized protein n=2 Tax=Sorghum bicolor TaxID=4558 RepID=A0A921ULS6_SORBI|nr:hypothetical protein BDA96_04G267400 [Sorghum bicolor]OQU85467.1 hypothetical protein SORBI_3004G251150 [Sorghum bicolor]
MAKNEKPTTACFLNPNFLALLTQRRRSAALGSSPPTRPCRTPHSSPLLVAPASCPLSALLSTPARPPSRPAGSRRQHDTTANEQGPSGSRVALDLLPHLFLTHVRCLARLSSSSTRPRGIVVHGPRARRALPALSTLALVPATDPAVGLGGL